MPWWEIPDHLEVKNHKLHIGGIEAEEIAHRYGVYHSPVAVYDGDLILENHKIIRDAFDNYKDRPCHIYVAVKANPLLGILDLLHQELDKEDLYADVVSPNEGKLCLHAGFPKKHIKFTGTSVSDHDLDMITDMALVINCDSFSQIRRLAKYGSREVSIRWNPGEGVGETEGTITAGEHVKFGIPEERIYDAFETAQLLNLDPTMLHQHIGSNWKGDEVNAFLDTVDKTLETAHNLMKNSKNGKLKEVSFGGGPGIRYQESDPSFDIELYAKGICERVKESDAKINAIAIEPGRYIFGNAGVLLTQINTVEEKGVPLMGDNSGFNHLIRPQLYDSYHELVLCDQADIEPKTDFMIAGNLCESGDVRTGDKHVLRPMPNPREGDILAHMNYGAYGSSMASEYNSRPLPAEVLVLDGKTYIIRGRGELEDLLRRQHHLVRR